MFIDSTISSSYGFWAGLVNLRLFTGDLDLNTDEKPVMQACVFINWFLLPVAARPRFPKPVILVIVLRRMELSVMPHI